MQQTVSNIKIEKRFPDKENKSPIIIIHDVGRLPVVRDWKLAGMITRSDTIIAHAKELARQEM